MIDLGVVRPGSTIRIPFSSFDKDDGSSITMTGYTTADILIYKDGNDVQRASVSGFTATTNFDTQTGKHLAIIVLSDNSTTDFFAAGSEYLVAIDAVTVDAVTTGGWIARFSIGYPGAIHNTTIATLATQTSFTLTDGPAENDALNGLWCIIHDAASAVQWGTAIVDDYTGATKTVTLAAATTFTAAAKSNISFMGLAPLQPTVAARKLDVSATGEAGLDWANIGSPTTVVNLSATNIDTDQVVASIAGTTLANLDVAVSTRLAPTVAARTLDVSAGGAAGVDWANVETPGSTVGLSATTISTGQVVASVAGAVGSVTGLTAANLDVAVSTRSSLTAANVNAEVVDALNVDTYVEPTAAPAATATLVTKIGWLFALARNKRTQTSTSQALRNDADSGSIATSAVDDDGTTATRSEWV